MPLTFFCWDRLISSMGTLILSWELQFIKNWVVVDHMNVYLSLIWMNLFKTRVLTFGGKHILFFGTQNGPARAATVQYPLEEHCPVRRWHLLSWHLLRLLLQFLKPWSHLLKWDLFLHDIWFLFQVATSCIKWRAQILGSIQANKLNKSIHPWQSESPKDLHWLTTWCVKKISLLPHLSHALIDWWLHNFVKVCRDSASY